jgi:tetratricopeptide (TPR) repeat protein
LKAENRTILGISIVAAILAAGALVVAILIYAALPGAPDEQYVVNARRLAGELADNNLPTAAIDEYRRILERGSLDNSQRGAINYLIGKIYFEAIGDYEQAAAYYIKARSLDEQASYNAEAGKNLIACLEKLGRSLDARRELDYQTSLEPDSSQPAGKRVALVGSGEITVSQFKEAFNALPPAMQQQMNTPESKRQFLDQLIGRELIYHAALREGYDSDPRVLRDLRMLEKDYLVQVYSQEKIAPTVKPDSADLMLYYNGNKEKYGDKDFNEVRETVMQDYGAYIGQKAINEYVSGLLQAEPVQVFEENIP